MATLGVIVPVVQALRGCQRRWWGPTKWDNSDPVSASVTWTTESREHRCTLGKYHFFSCQCACGAKGDLS